MAYYTCLLMDADNTLLDFDAAEREAIADTLSHYGLPHDTDAIDTYHRVNRQLWDSLAKGELNRNKLFAIRFSRVLQAMGLPEPENGREMNDYYEGELAKHADLIPGSLSALEELGEVATLAIVSNGAQAVQEARLSASGIDRFMDGIYISEKVGAAKPSAKLFDYCLRDLGLVNRSRVLVVGDDLMADIKGGINAGLDTCWVNFANEENHTDIQPKYTVQSYEELYKIVMEPEELENVGVRSRRHRNEG
ncbi:MAG: YjjG family noncanonical pyrimidine nucleotidase [Oscillospiraceae bacterium]|nr:YjjG family noncanonical pyrimidine nucleotidase [Oscillospiraceae bacterium]